VTPGRPWLAVVGASILVVALLLRVDAWLGWLLAAGAAQGRADELLLGIRLFQVALAFHGVIALGFALAPVRPCPSGLFTPPPTGASFGGTRALLALLAVGTAIRFVGLGGDLWHDELFTWLGLVKLPFLRILSEYPDDNQHLVFTLASHLSTLVFGERFWAVRLPSLVFGVASLAATWRLGRLLLGEREAFFATALLTFSYHHVWFSGNARGYTALLLATLVATELFLRALEDGRWRTWVLYAGVLALGMGAHLTMVFVAAAHGLVLLALLRRPGSAPGVLRGLAGLALAGTFTLQLYALALPPLVAFYVQPSAGVTEVDVVWKSPFWLVAEAIRSLGLGAVGGLALLLGAIPVLVGGVALLRRSPAAAFSFALPALLGFLALWLLGRNLWPRFFFNSFGFAALVLMHGVLLLAGWLATRLTRAPWLPVATALLLVLASAATVPRAFGPKMDYTGARDWVLAEAQPSDRVVAIDLLAAGYGAYYAPTFDEARTHAELRAHLEATDGDVYILYAFGGYIEAQDAALWDLIQNGFEEVAAFRGTLGDGTIVVRRYPSRVARPVP
jgi:hypothetical protein